MSGSKIYNEILSNLHRKLKRFRKGSFERENRLLNAVSEHIEIAVAFKNKDYDKLENLTVSHVQNARDNILSLDIFS